MNIPDMCYGLNFTTINTKSKIGDVIRIAVFETGYRRSTFRGTQKDVDEMNRKLGVNPTVARAMESASMFGWDRYKYFLNAYLLHEKPAPDADRILLSDEEKSFLEVGYRFSSRRFEEKLSITPIDTVNQDASHGFIVSNLGTISYPIAKFDYKSALLYMSLGLLIACDLDDEEDETVDKFTDRITGVIESTCTVYEGKPDAIPVDGICNYTLQFRATESEDWIVMGKWDDTSPEKRTLLFKAIDSEVGFLRVIDENGVTVFQRATASSKKKASDDCHTYS